MYDYLEGQVAGRTAARLVLDVHGVGYEISVPLGTSFPASGPLKLWTHFVVREDSQQLFGFREEATRDTFRALLTVTGVGPKVALAVLSGLTRDELLAAVAADDLAPLVGVKGIGRRTAQQIVFDLKSKLPMLRAGPAGDAVLPEKQLERQRQIEDAITALVSIGYSEKEARKQVERAAKSVDPSQLELLVRAALQH